MSDAQYWTIVYQYIRSLFIEPLCLFFILYLAPVCLLLPCKYHVCTLLYLNLNITFTKVYKEVNQRVQTATLHSG